MKDEQPFVSILMTSYNREKYIAEAIKSVLDSTYKNFEFIILDDASSDNTVNIAKKYAKEDNRIKVFVNEKNLDQFPNRNKASAYATGWLLFYVDSDDMIQPDAIEYVVNQFVENKQVNFSTIYYHDDIKMPLVLKPSESLNRHFFKNGFLNVGPGGTVIKNEYFKAIGRFPEKYGPVGDMYYNLKAAANTNILLLPYQYLIYRRHDNQEINKKYTYLCNGHRYLADAMSLPALPLTENEKNYILKKSARQNIRRFMRHMKNTGEIVKTFKAYKISGIKIKDLF